MIKLIELPQRSDVVANYKIEDDKLTVIVNGVSETFDFTGLQDGIAEEFVVEKLPINPVLKAEKVGNTINVEVLRFYSFDEKELFENGDY